MDNALVHIKRTQAVLPPKGHVCIMHLTDKQFSMSQVFFSGKKEKNKAPTQQLELF